MYWKVQVEQDFEFYVKESEIYSSGNFSPLKVLGIGAPMDLCAKLLQSCLILYDPMSVAYQGHLSMGFSRQEYWSGLTLPSVGELPNSGIKPRSIIAGGFFTS